MRTLALCLALAALPASAQDRQGNDTPGEWVIDHARSFGLWDSFCDHRTIAGGDERERRCYLRYVDVFSPRPDFAAQFAFVTPGPQVEFGMEAGTLFAEDGFRIDRAGETVWVAPQAGCLVGLACRYDGAQAEALLAAMSAGGTFVFDFTDRHGVARKIRWDLTPFAAAMDDLRTQSEARGL